MSKKKRGKRSLHRRWKDSWLHHPDPAVVKRGATIDSYVFDHGALRFLWRNFYPLDEEVWRSNQPDPPMIRRLAKQGFRSILNLRGDTEWGSYLLEQEACTAAGVTLIDFEITSRKAPTKEMIEGLAEIFATAERKLLIHCKSGADRAGFVSALYLILEKGVSVETALKQLSLKYLHVRGAQTGIMRFMLERFEAETTSTGKPLLEWVREDYDPAALAADYKSGVAASFVADRLLRRE